MWLDGDHGLSFMHFQLIRGLRASLLSLLNSVVHSTSLHVCTRPEGFWNLFMHVNLNSLFRPACRVRIVIDAGIEIEGWEDDLRG